VSDAHVQLLCTAAERQSVLAQINEALRDDGLIKAWRNETYPVACLASGECLATFERAASRFWGTLTLGTHATGYVADESGRPTHLWIAQRALDKATDPGAWDNLVGGGVPAGQSPLEALVREAWEEAGLRPTQLQGLRPGRVIRLRRDIPEGLQLEDVHGFDLAMPPGLVPANQDGEVAGFELLPVAEALARAAGTQMTVDAALVTLDFALRHGLVEPPPGVQALFEPWAG
jgi:8-oxo-dGTP pyrophosphatase MutT (NUDIX family)